MKVSSNLTKAWWCVLLAGFLWGVGALVAQSAMHAGISPHSLSLARFALGLPLLLFWHWRQHVDKRRHSRWTALPWRMRLHIVLTGVAMAANVTCWFLGIERIGATLPTVISICFAPVLVAVFSVARGYEHISARLLCGLVLGVVGVALIVVAGDFVLPKDYVAGLAWSFGSALLYAMVVLGNARVPKQVSSVTASAWSMSAATIFMLLVCAIQGVTLPHTQLVWLQVGYTGIVTTSIAYLAFAWGAKHLPPTAAVVGTLIEPLAAAVLAAWLWNEQLTAQQYAGAASLALAMYILSRQQRAD
ncbi:MAG: DMT family transporter [Pseudomonadota bacterium]